MLSNLGGAKIFSSLDLRSAFHQIELSEDSRELTTFSVNFRKYHFKKLPFGYCNSPGVFQSIMCKALQKLLGTLCFVFIDDILVFSKSVNSHLSDIKEVLESLRNGNLSVKLEKCSFFQSQVEYLGHRISGEGIACINNGKLETMSRPNNVKELQRFLGVANFFRKFIPVFSRVAYPLYQLLRKDKEFIWDVACESAFIKLKGCLLIRAERDPFCIEIINILRGKLDSNVRDLDSYILNEGILYRKRKFLGEKNYSAESTVLNIVVPSTLLQKAINYVHYRHHTGVKHTLFSFKLLYYHPNERSMVMTYVGNCDVCKILKGRVDVPIEIQTAPIARKPFEAVAIDFLGPLISTDSGNRYILSCVDLFSRFSVLNALPNRSSEAVISCLINIFDKFGYPRILLSDNALEFKANSVQLFAKINSVIKKEVLPFSPFSNGIVERRNTGITRLLKLYLNWVPHNNWDAFLSTVENTINNQLNISLGDTPAFVVFGRVTCPNIERKELSTIANLEDVENNVKYMAQNRLFIQEFVRNNIINETNKRNTYRNKKRIVKNLEIGDRVLVRNHLKRNKLDLSWLGPGRVVDVGKNYCVLELGNKKIKSNLNHVIKLLGK